MKPTKPQSAVHSRESWCKADCVGSCRGVGRAGSPSLLNEANPQPVRLELLAYAEIEGNSNRADGNGFTNVSMYIRSARLPQQEIWWNYENFDKKWKWEGKNDYSGRATSLKKASRKRQRLEKNSGH
jgi:hypothetical protein